MSKQDYFSKRARTVTKRQVIWRTLFSFVIFFALLGCGYLAWRHLYHEQETDNIQSTLRKSHEANEKIFGKLFDKSHEAKKYTEADAVKKVRVNGNVGMGNDFDVKAWRLKVARKPGDTLVLTIDDIQALPRTEVIFDFKCIEGWSQVTRWAGVRFTDFIQKYNLASDQAQKYVGLITPDEAYYVGIDMPSMLQSQTILCYEMNGQPLPMNQGYPLRLIIPVKYGIKHLKRIGTMYFSNTKPADYWAEQGYDYYSGL